jgi:hypothetical protein
MDLYSVYFSDASTGTAVGQQGMILRTISGGIGIKQISTTVPRNFDLPQNYPNPFNPVTKIRFSIPHARDAYMRPVQIKIYDALGREIEILVNENLRPGVYEVDWNASAYPSGIYFYSLSAGDYMQTKKMILVK